MNEDIAILVQAEITRAPVWIRRDLLSLDLQKRMVAEETLAARISQALASAKASKGKI